MERFLNLIFYKIKIELLYLKSSVNLGEFDVSELSTIYFEMIVVIFIYYFINVSILKNA